MKFVLVKDKLDLQLENLLQELEKENIMFKHIEETQKPVHQQYSHDNPRVRYAYIRDENKHPRVTIVQLWDGQDYAYGWCTAKNDNPCRKIGRELALKRATETLEQKLNKVIDRDDFNVYIYSRDVRRAGTMAFIDLDTNDEGSTHYAIFLTEKNVGNFLPDSLDVGI